MSAEVRTEEVKGEENATQTILTECKKQKEDRGCESQFSDYLQTLLFGQLCLAVL